MSTWWRSARRTDLNLATTPQSFAITNRGWHILNRFLKALNVESVGTIAGKDIFVPTNLAHHWGSKILSADMDRWFQLGKWDGTSVVAAGVIHEMEAPQYLNTHELVPLAGTILGDWLIDIGQQLALAPSGLVISGKPRKETRMSANLVKGGKANLSKLATEAGNTAGLDKVSLRLGWDARKTTGAEYDLDASAIGVGADGKAVGKEWFVFFNNLSSPQGEIVHQGDELTGGKEGDDEQINVSLSKIPANVTEIVAAVTIYEAKQRGNQSFTLVDNAFVRVVDEATGTELARFDLTEDTEPGVNCLVFGKLYRKDAEWQFKAIGDGFTDELDGLTKAYSI